MWVRVPPSVPKAKIVAPRFFKINQLERVDYFFDLFVSKTKYGKSLEKSEGVWYYVKYNQERNQYE